MANDRISPHFKYSEFLVSRDHPELAAKMILRGLDCVKLHYLVWMLLEPVRICVDHKFKILSGMRSTDLNDAVGGSKTSDHLFLDYACACDFTVLHDDAKESQVLVYEAWLQLREMQYGQLIYYGADHGNFVHVSLPTMKHQNEIMTKTHGGYNRR